jgi:hypothetical protein
MVNRPRSGFLRAHPTSRSPGLLAPRWCPLGCHGCGAGGPKRGRGAGGFGGATHSIAWRGRKLGRGGRQVTGQGRLNRRGVCPERLASGEAFRGPGESRRKFAGFRRVGLAGFRAPETFKGEVENGYASEKRVSSRASRVPVPRASGAAMVSAGLSWLWSWGA